MFPEFCGLPKPTLAAYTELEASSKLLPAGFVTLRRRHSAFVSDTYGLPTGPVQVGKAHACDSRASLNANVTR